MVQNILTIDIEELFYNEYMQKYSGPKLTYRTPYNISPILQLLEEQNIQASFFIVGDIAEKFPWIIKRIIEAGHEVAFHGWSHKPLWMLTAERLKEEVIAFKKIHSNCKGYRAPSFSLNNRTRWALNILHKEHFKYDSSIFPSWTPSYGVYHAPIKPYKISLNDVSKESDEEYSIIEFPLAIYNIYGIKIPIAGGFWLRLWDTNFIKRGIRKMNEKGYPAVFYIHNWELDSETPKINLTFPDNVITYYNINKTKLKFLSLLKNISFTNFTNYLK